MFVLTNSNNKQEKKYLYKPNATFWKSLVVCS